MKTSLTISIRLLFIGMLVLLVLGYPSTSTAASLAQTEPFTTIFEPPQANFKIILGKNIDCSYGSTNCATSRKGDYHTGVDSSSDLEIRAVADGIVTLVPMPTCNKGFSCPDHGMGNVVIVMHTLLNGQVIYSLYAHLDSINQTLPDGITPLKNGMCISKGIPIGIMGNSGQGQRHYSKYDPHLHLEFKSHPVLGDPKTATSVYESKNWGYIETNTKPKPADPYPDSWGYDNPMEYLNIQYAATCPKSIAVGNHPNVIVINETTNRIYVSNASDSTSLENDSNVSVIDGSTNSIITTIPIVYTSTGIAVNPVTNIIYVAQTYVGQVLAIDGENNNPLYNMGFGGTEMIPDIAVNPNNDRMYIIRNTSHTLFVNTTPISTSIPLPENPLRVAVNPNNNRIYVLSGTTPSQVSVINEDTKEIIATIPVGNNARYMTVSPVSGKVYVSNEASKSITIIDGKNDAHTFVTFSVGDHFPEGIAVNPVTERIYVSLADVNGVQVYDGLTYPPTPIALVPVGNRPFPVAVNFVTNKVYVGNYYDGTVNVFLSP